MTHQPLLSTLSAVVETVVRLRAAGRHKVVLVCSGAIRRQAAPAHLDACASKKSPGKTGEPEPAYNSFGLL
jgi:glutamate 5-kinase